MLCLPRRFLSAIFFTFSNCLLVCRQCFCNIILALQMAVFLVLYWTAALLIHRRYRLSTDTVSRMVYYLNIASTWFVSAKVMKIFYIRVIICKSQKKSSFNAFFFRLSFYFYAVVLMCLLYYFTLFPALRFF